MDLRPYGYAPGGYSFKCIDCPDDVDPMDQWAAKRAWRCEKHAKIAFALELEFPAALAAVQKPLDGTIIVAPKFIPFNVNHNVRVKLNDRGLAELKRQHDELRRRVPTLDPWKPPATDEDGFSRFQLWDLMKSLGHLCVLGMEPPFETTIRIPLGQK
jgi:hypothetical protein